MFVLSPNILYLPRRQQIELCFSLQNERKGLKYAPSRNVHLVGIKLIPLQGTLCLCSLGFLMLIYGQFQGMLCASHTNN